MEEAPIAEIKPNVRNAFLSNFIVIAVIVALIILTLFYLNNVVGLDILVDTLEQFGIHITKAALLGGTIVLIIIGTAILMVMDYVAIGKSRYTLYKDRMVYSKNMFILQLKEEVIPYQNIVKITYQRKGILNSMDIILELTGLSIDKVEIAFVDNAKEVSEGILKLIGQYKSNYYAKFSQDYRYQNVMDQL
ncbi:MAG: hypothetical protein U9O94_05300 [Nanoarchaeota archaeon]|nr:hypothetical protein [Nanoarchaeota archaeon]